MDLLGDAREAVGAIRREQGNDAGLSHEVGRKGENFVRRAAAVDRAKDGGDAFGNEGVTIRAEVGAAVAEFWDKPELRRAAVDLILIELGPLFQCRTFLAERHNVEELIFPVRDGIQLVDNVLGAFAGSHKWSHSP